MTTHITEVDTTEAPESLLRQMHEHYLLWDVEFLPDDPPESREHRLADWRVIPGHMLLRHWVLWEDGVLAAVALVRMKRHEELNNALGWTKPTGDFVGLSEVVVFEHQPEIVLQGDTGVVPAHRDKGLGRWLKASMIERLIEERPETERLFTGNAGSNQPMLNINVAMGYRPAAFINAWQGDVAVVKERMGL